MKRALICLLCLTCLFLETGAAQAGTPAEAQAIQHAKSNLTEVYGYTYEDAESFDFRFADQEGWRILSFAPISHPGWVYTAKVDPQDGSLEDFTCPFATGYEGYPGQNSVQDVLYRAKEKGWFSRWDKAAMEAFDQALTDNAIRRAGPSGPLFVSLSLGEMTAAQAVQSFFVACYGEPLGWTGATKEWRDEVLAANGLTLETEKAAPADGVLSYTA